MEEDKEVILSVITVTFGDKSNGKLPLLINHDTCATDNHTIIVSPWYKMEEDEEVVLLGFNSQIQ